MNRWWMTSAWILCWPTLLFSQEVEQLSEARRIQAHLVLQDYQSAKEEALKALLCYPQSESIHESYIKALACLGLEKEMIQAWQSYIELFPNKIQNRELIEEMCWGVIHKASASPALGTRLISMLAAYFSQDTSGVEILRLRMRDSNSVIRAVAVELASHFRDAKLKNEVRRLFKEEKVWKVRQQVLKAIGKMKIRELNENLRVLIASEQALVEEKALAIDSLIHMWDHLEREEVVKLARSNRAGLRLLACRAIGHFFSERDSDQLLIMAVDNHPSVKAAALQALGIIHYSQDAHTIIELAKNKLDDSDFQTAISAAWLLMLYSPIEGQQAIEHYLNDRKQEVRLFAAAALRLGGKYGTPLALRYFKSHSDPFVRLNLAVGLIGQRQATMQAAQVLEHVLSFEKEKWTSWEKGIFKAIVPYSLHQEEDTTTPETNNQLIRLEILNLLAIVKAPQAQESIRQFLMERSWGISGIAAALLLMEGDDIAIDLVKSLLEDKNDKVRIQAALILSLWSRDESIIQVLEESYKMADKELKERILEGLGRIGSIRSVPFLINVLKEPSQQLRIIGATALIQCLNH